MKQKTFNSVAGTIFLVVALVHLFRVLNNWPIAIHTSFVPMWASWIGFIVAGYLAFQGLKKRN